MSAEFKSEQAEIKGVETKAAAEKEETLKQKLQTHHAVFFNETDRAAQIADDAKLKDPKNIQELNKSKEQIRGFLVNVASKGKSILEIKDPNAPKPYQEIDALSASVKTKADKLKNDAPVYASFESAKTAYDTGLGPAINALAEISASPQMTPKDKADRLVKAEKAYQISFDKAAAINLPGVPPELQSSVNELNQLMIKANNEICQTKLDGLSDEDKNNLPEAKVGDAFKQFQEVDRDVTKANTLLGKLKGPNLPDAEYDQGMKEILPMANANLDKLVALRKVCAQINEDKLPPNFQTYLNSIKAGIDQPIKQMMDLKLYCRNREIVDSINRQKLMILITPNRQDQYGTYESRQRATDKNFPNQSNCFVFNRNGDIALTPEFAAQGKDGIHVDPELRKSIMLMLQQQMQAARAEIYTEVRDKDDSPDAKEFRDAKKNLDSNRHQAQQDLLKYLNTPRAANSENNARLAECKEILKQIAQKDLDEAYKRVQALGVSVKANGIAMGRDPGQYLNPTDDMGADAESLSQRAGVGKPMDIVNMRRSQNARVERYLEAQEAMLRKAMDMINSGECTTFEQAEARLKSVDFPKPELLTAYEKEQQEIDKAKDNPSQYHGNKVKSLQEQIDKAKDDPQAKAALEKQLEKLKKEDPQKYYETQKKIVGDRVAELTKQYQRDRTSQLMWRTADLPPEYKEVYDVFEQQKNINNANPQAREAYMNRLLTVAREHGMTELAQSVAENYFEKELQEANKQVSRAQIEQELTQKVRTHEKYKSALNQIVDEGIEEFKKTHPGQEVPAGVKQKLWESAFQMVVDTVYNREVKKVTYENMQKTPGARTDVYNSCYGNFFGNIEKVGIHGDVEFSESDLRGLPQRLAVQLVTMIVAGALSGGAASLAGAGLLNLGVGATGVAAGSFLAETLTFTAVQGGLDSFMQWRPGIYASGGQFATSWAEGAATLGVLKGAGALSEFAGFGAMSTAERAALRESYGAGRGTAMVVAQSGGRWFVRTNIGGAALTGASSEMAWLQGREFSAQEGIQSFADNFILSAGVEAGHGLAAQRKNVVEPRDLLPRREAVGKPQASVTESRPSEAPRPGPKPGEPLPAFELEPITVTESEAPTRVRQREETPLAEAPTGVGTNPLVEAPTGVDLNPPGAPKPAAPKPAEVEARSPKPARDETSREEAPKVEGAPKPAETTPELTLDPAVQKARLAEKLENNKEASARVDAAVNKLRERPEFKNLTRDQLISRLSPEELRLMANDVDQLPSAVIEKVVGGDYVTVEDTVNGERVTVRCYVDNTAKLGAGGLGTVNEGYFAVWERNGRTNPESNLRRGAVKIENPATSQEVEDIMTYARTQEVATGREVRNLPDQSGLLPTVYTGTRKIFDSEGRFIREETIVITPKIEKLPGTKAPTLASAMPNTPLEFSCDCMSKALEGEDKLHNQLDRMHGDIKPGNIFVGTIDGRPIAVLGDLASIPFSDVANAKVVKGVGRVRNSITGETDFIEISQLEITTKDGRVIKLPATAEYSANPRTALALNAMVEWMKAHPGERPPPGIKMLSESPMWSVTLEKFRKECQRRNLPPGTEARILARIDQAIQKLDNVPDLNNLPPGLTREQALAGLSGRITDLQLKAEIDDIGRTIREAQPSASPSLQLTN